MAPREWHQLSACSTVTCSPSNYEVSEHVAGEPGTSCILTQAQQVEHVALACRLLLSECRQAPSTTAGLGDGVLATSSRASNCKQRQLVNRGPALCPMRYITSFATGRLSSKSG